MGKYRSGSVGKYSAAGLVRRTAPVYSSERSTPMELSPRERLAGAKKRRLLGYRIGLTFTPSDGVWHEPATRRDTALGTWLWLIIRHSQIGVRRWH